MSAKLDKERSRILSYVLRHAPQEIGLTLDAGGWADVTDLLARATVDMTRDDLHRIVSTSDKTRFALSEDGSRIRANQGHSVPVDLGLAACTPPDRLYHGTVVRFLEAIEAEGLRPMERHHVHLSPDIDTARAVGARRGPPVILSVDAAAMQAEGALFFRSENGVWLTDSVPPQHMTRLPD